MKDIWKCGGCGQKWRGNDFRVRPCPVCRSKNVASIIPEDIRQVEQRGDILRALDGINHALDIGLLIEVAAIAGIVLFVGPPALAVVLSLVTNPIIGGFVGGLCLLTLILGWLNKMARKRDW